MKTVNYLIVKAKDIYKNEKNGFITNSSIETVLNINREVEVVSAPDFTILKEGDQVLIHHNILRYRNNMKGVVVQSDYFLGFDGDYILYFVPLTEVFMYKRGDSDWQALDPYCFVRPIKKEDGSLILRHGDNFDHKGNLMHHGVMVYPNKQLSKQGIKKGDVVIFSLYSEYEFDFGDEVLYKMSTRDILMKG